MAKKSKRSVAEELEEIIDQDLLSDRSIPWESCAEQLEQIAEFCSELGAHDPRRAQVIFTHADIPESGR